jgi:anti-sigma regulatory factor (Ser/Thr protein kinase)
MTFSDLDDQRDASYREQWGRQEGQELQERQDEPRDSLRPFVSTRARIALYDDLLSAPRIIDIDPAPVIDFIESIASQTYTYAQQQGGSLPYSVIREIAENFIHAHFKECTISVLAGGNTIRFSDQGPGIEKKRLVQEPGITSATTEMKRFIRGVGSGFPIVREYLEFRNGFLSIDDNAKEGTVVTLSLQTQSTSSEQQLNYQERTDRSNLAHHKTGAGQQDVLSGDDKGALAQKQTSVEKIDQRSLQVLQLLYEKGILGPSDLMGPLKVSAATAHRVLVGLEQKGLIESTPHRKRILSSAGLSYLEADDQHT